MTQSILNSMKKILGIDEAYTHFDEDIKLHINSVFSDLHQIGIGPQAGFAIDDDEELWTAFLGENPLLNSVKTYMGLRVRLLFDPPSTSFHITSMDEQIKKLEWRLNVLREETEWVNPNVVIDEDEVVVLDGGSP